MNGTIEFLLAGLLVLSQFLTELPDQEFMQTASNQQLAQSYSKACLNILDHLNFDPANLDVMSDLLVNMTQDKSSPLAQMAFGETSLQDAMALMKGLCRPQPDAKIVAQYDFAKAVDIYKSLKADLPDPRILLDLRLPETTLVKDRSGRPVGDLFVEEGRRKWVSINQVPIHVQQAFVAAEDQHYYEHDGVDTNGVLRAFIKGVMSSGRPEGGSSITQQVVKNLLVGNDLTLERKFQEMLLAQRVEAELWSSKEQTKSRILEIYLNIVYQGRNSWGVGMSAQAYFGKDVAELSLAEAAFLAGINRGPNYYAPDRHYERAMARRDYVLRRMREDGYITSEQEKQAKAEPIRYTGAVFENQAPYYVREVKEALLENVDSNFDFGAGAIVNTTLDSSLQKLTDRALREGLIDYEKRSGRYKWHGPESSIAEALAKKIEAQKQQDNKHAKLREALRKKLGKADDAGGDEGSAESEEGEAIWVEVMQSSSLPGVPSGLPWLQAVILEVGQKVKIGLGDGRQGVLTAENQKWAQGLRFGDIVYVKASGQDGAYEIQQAPEVQGAAIVMDARTGDVLAMTGGFNYDLSGFNRATHSKRQPGSTLKPFTYMAALQMGIPPNALFDDKPQYFAPIRRGGKAWRPQNYSGNYLGVLPMRKGLEQSRNAYTAAVMKRIGLDPIIDTAVDFGVYDNPGRHYPFILGAEETTLLRMVRAYAMIANGGIRIEPRVIRDVTKNGRSLYRDLGAIRGTVSSVDRTTLAQIRSLLQGVVERGTAARMKDLAPYVAGKTGTTSNYIDSWFVGFTQDIVVGVYAGYDNDGERRNLGQHGTGSGLALPIFESIIRGSFEVYKKPEAFPNNPSEVELKFVHPKSGLVVSPEVPESIPEFFRHGSVTQAMYDLSSWNYYGARYLLDSPDPYTGAPRANDEAPQANKYPARGESREASRSSSQGSYERQNELDRQAPRRTQQQERPSYSNPGGTRFDSSSPVPIRSGNGGGRRVAPPSNNGRPRVEGSRDLGGSQRPQPAPSGRPSSSGRYGDRSNQQDDRSLREILGDDYREAPPSSRLRRPSD